MDFRVAYLQEAKRCLRYNAEQKVTQLEFWANLLGAVANAAVASVPDSVAHALSTEQARQQVVRTHIRDRLGG